MEKTQGYIQILPKAEGKEYSTFYVYLPAGAAYWAQYRFVYMQNPVNIALDYTNGPNDAANCKLFRIRGAYIGTLTGDAFTPHFRALQQGEISLAFREEGAGDFCGGFHGDEVLTGAVLTADGRTLPLDQPYFGAFCAAEFVEDSILNRCNTPELPLLRHTQRYVFRDGQITLTQRAEWLHDAKPLVAAFMPMLTAQRLDPDQPTRILTDTVEFYDRPNGALLCRFSTAGYGAESDGVSPDRACIDTPATAVKVFGTRSGFSAEAGFRVLNESIPQAQIAAHLWIRFGTALDNKIYFNIGKNTAPKAGTVWESEVYYRLRIQANP